MPMLPEAPLRLSMTMRVPSCAPSGSAMRRAVMSTLPPGERARSADRLARIALGAGELRDREDHGGQTQPEEQASLPPRWLS
jgi:hypothetical protein